MGFLSNVGDFEKFNLKEMFSKIGKDPERLLYGSADPLSTGMWNKALGTDNEAIVDQWGGASKDTYGKAEASGIDTKNGHQMHQAARVVAGLIAGNYGAQQAGIGGGGGTEGGQGGGMPMPQNQQQQTSQQPDANAQLLESRRKLEEALMQQKMAASGKTPDFQGNYYG